MRTLLLLVLVFLLPACAGSFEEARAPHVKFVGALPPPDPARCASLDDQHRNWGLVSKTSAVLGGSAGLATVPVKNDDLRVGLAIGAISGAAIAVGTGFASDSAATSYMRECTR